MGSETDGFASVRKRMDDGTLSQYLYSKSLAQGQTCKYKKPGGQKFPQQLLSKHPLSVESLPAEILVKIFSYLDVASLLCAGCVSKRFSLIASDNVLWCKIFACRGLVKRTWKSSAVDKHAESLAQISVQDKPLGYWKKECLRTWTSSGKAGVGQMLRSINKFTGLPRRTAEALKSLGVHWIVVLKDKSGKEFVVEPTGVHFHDTSVTVSWTAAFWPNLSSLTALQIHGVTWVHLDPSSKVPKKNWPRRRSLVTEYDLTNLKAVSVPIASDKLIQLSCLTPGLLMALWKEGVGITFVMACLHYYHLLERSTLGSATSQYQLPPHQPLLDDIDPDCGLHGYYLHIELHNNEESFMSGGFRNLFCKRDYIQNGYLRLTAISYKKTSEHTAFSGRVGLSWKTDGFEGKVQNCCLMDVTVLDDEEKPFWCVSTPVSLRPSANSSVCYDYTGQSLNLHYCDAEGKIHMVLEWEADQYYLTNLVLYLSTDKVNNWFGTNY
ncbi:F-box only protein 15 [Protopterus annectens]|uniref:F-box only protein 15 n=1 Tax=Protopterus annectens TaxID=7888 RepID=UPI001CFB159C|nr:F-box only protein 15 [Protopterus annectens]